LGGQVRDVLHIADLCELVEEQVRQFKQWEGWLGNVSGGREQSVSLCELTDLCRRITGQTTLVEPGGESRAFDMRIFIGDCSRLFERTAWRPRRGIEDVVRDTFEWVQQNQSLLQSLN
ncbi:MAG: 3-beta hydroxysteroid dehydrogenase, partial [Roseimicrobium sp.]